MADKDRKILYIGPTWTADNAWSYNISSGTTTQVGSTITTADHSRGCSGFSNDKFILFGGTTVSSNRISYIDLYPTGSWTVSSDESTFRSTLWGCETIAIESGGTNLMYVLGGAQQGASGYSGYINDIYVYDVDADDGYAFKKKNMIDNFEI